MTTVVDTRGVTKPTALKALSLLLGYVPVCGTEMVTAGVGYRYSARVGDLRTAGFEIMSQPCTVASHGHTSRIYEFLLVPDDLMLFEEAV